ncbi:MAG: C4-dicarboxylic acid transporter DauA [Sandaracinaceae bacterium]|nr:C4-dicarboxylic acid transporter DauA [Sandaracinaceae bacterium]
MRRRYEQLRAALPHVQLQPAAALRRAWKQGYTREIFRADLVAGIAVGVVALPLSMALAIASGVPPQHGLYTAIVGGAIIAILGGSKVQVSGPTAAFVVLLAPVSARYGLGGLLLATAMAGVILIAMGVMRMGRLIQFIPYPVTTGFTAGIAVVIATLQFKDLLGLDVPHTPEKYLERVGELFRALPSSRWQDFAVGAFTLIVLLLVPRFTKRVPAALIALSLAAAGATLLPHVIPQFSVATIGTRFSYVADGVVHGGLPQLPPLPVLPWNFPAADGHPLVLSLELVRSLLSSAFAIAVLGAIASLLSAVVADGLSGKRHDPDAELVAQGVGNIIAPFFGGIAATGAIARTATNVRAGARTPIAAVIHSVFLLVAIAACAPLLSYLPMASMAALLLVVAWNMSEARHFLHTVRVAPKSDVLILLTCFSLTILFDMVVSVTFGVLLAALLFMKRMADVADVRMVGDRHSQLLEPLPQSVLIYEIAGPLFFGAAQKAASVLGDVQAGVSIVIIDMRAVPIMDATGLVNLESVLAKLNEAKVLVIFGGVQKQPMSVFDHADWPKDDARFLICETIQEAIAQARSRGAGSGG